MDLGYDAQAWESQRIESSASAHDSRNQWEHDYSRLVHYAGFRRLQAKTQVLGLGESDFYRTRLTHSMEVAQIGAGIVSSLKYDGASDQYLEYLPKHHLISAICLAHDIGHPPFGHGGEIALNVCMRMYGGFEGNGQTLRILSKLERHTRDYGINPSRRMLLGVLKYPASYREVVNHCAYGELDSMNRYLFRSDKQKPPKCYLDSEKEVVDFVLQPFSDSDSNIFRKTVRGSRDAHCKTIYKGLDTSIMEVADDISYTIHDLEDAIALRMIDRNAWMAHFSGSEVLFRPFADTDYQMSFKAVTDGLFGDSYERKDMIGRLVNLMITQCELYEVDQPFSSSLIAINVRLEEHADKLRSHMFSLVKEKVIRNESVQQLEFKGQMIVMKLFEVMASDPMRFLPKQHQATLKIANSEDDRYRVICDYIAGMTDDYAARVYGNIFLPKKGSVFSKL